MSLPQVIFLVISALMLASSLGVVLAKNQVHAAMSLVVSFFFLAADYVLLFAHTLAILQVLVYAGAIVVLFLFVIMLLAIRDEPRLPFMQAVSPAKVFGFVLSLAVGIILVSASLGPTMCVRVTSVQNKDGNWQVTFDHTPFRGSLFAMGSLGHGEAADTHFEVLSVGMQTPPIHLIDPVGALPRVGEVVSLTPQVSQLLPAFGTISELGGLVYGRYLLPFEATSLLLLVAIVGSVVVAKGKI